MIRSLRALILIVVAVLFLSSTAGAADKLRLLIIDGQNNHNWRVMTPPMKAKLESTGRFVVEVATTPGGKGAKEDWDKFRPDFSKFDVVLSNYNGQSWPEPVNKGLEKFVSSGGGLVIIHAANNSFGGWKEYNKMIALGWRNNKYGDRLTVDDSGKPVITPAGKGPGAGHGRQHAFEIVVRDSEHPVMKGMPKKWMHARDELYHGQRGPAKLHLLATAWSDKKTGGTGAHEPMIWFVPYGKGRVFTTVMGHVTPTDSIRCVGFQTVMCRGSEWAATGKVTIPIPDDFPTDKVKLAP